MKQSFYQFMEFLHRFTFLQSRYLYYDFSNRIIFWSSNIVSVDMGTPACTCNTTTTACLTDHYPRQPGWGGTRRNIHSLTPCDCGYHTTSFINFLYFLLMWCLRTLLVIKWYQFVCNEELRRITKQSNVTAIIQSRRLSIFGHIARIDDDADAKWS